MTFTGTGTPLGMAEHRVRLLGQAIGEFLIAAGVVVDAPMTGPEVLAHLELVTEDLRNGVVQLKASA